MMRKTVVIMILLLATVVWLSSSMSVTAAPHYQATSVPVESSSASSGGFPYLGLLVLIIPFFIMIYKNSRPNAAKQVTGMSCAPIIDEEALARQRAKQDAAEAAEKS